MPEIVIECQNLGKIYQSSKKEPGFLGALKSFIKPENIQLSAIKNFDLKIERGEIVGLLGPNGAGKTTLIKMLTGIVPPSSGNAQVLGFEPFSRPKEFRRKIALVMGQKSQLWSTGLRRYHSASS